MGETSDQQDNTSAQKSGALKTGIVVALLGLVVGAGLYAVFGPSGNSLPGISVSGTPSKDQNATACTLSEERKARLDAIAVGHMAAFKMLDTPSSVAALTFKDGTGNQKTLADWKGRTVLLNLWATWCAPCRHEMPALDALQKAKGSETFEVLPISLDLGTDEKPKKFYKQIGIENLSLYHDGTLDTLNTLKKRGLAFGLPATLLIDSNGCAIGNLNGPAEWNSEDALKLMDAALN